MHFSWQSLFFITVLLFSSLFVNGLVLPSVMTQAYPSLCDSCDMALDFQHHQPPLKQFKKWHIAVSDVFCKQGFVLVIKKSDNSPACVNPDTAQKLVERGWGVLKEQLIWFEVMPIQCEQPPWADVFSSADIKFTELTKIKAYFKDKGIIIVDARKFLSVVSS